MLTDAPPRQKRRHKLFLDSDRLETLPLPPDSKLTEFAAKIEAAMKAVEGRDVQAASDEFLRAACDFYGVPRCPLRVLAARPLRVREYSTSELFGDYHPDTMSIRVWMRTAVRREVTSFGTFLSTLCHELAIIWISVGSHSAILGIHDASTAVPRSCTTTLERRRRRD